MIKIARCRGIEQPSLPMPLARHIVTLLIKCEELQDIDINRIPNKVLENVKKHGYVILDKNLASELLSLKLNDNEYVKVFVEDIK
ncbi:MAG: hypothetical protein QXL96_11360 [Ignisphaera sp.]